MDTTTLAVEVSADDVEDADALVVALLSDWMDAGRDPTALVVAMADIVNDISQECGQRIH